MKIWKLVSGILSIILFLVVELQSCAAGVVNSIENKGGTSGSVGMVCGVFLLVGGIVSIATRNGGKVNGNIALAVIFGVCGVIGIVGHGNYSDLVIWSTWALVNAVVAICLIVKANTNKLVSLPENGTNVEFSEDEMLNETRVVVNDKKSAFEKALNEYIQELELDEKKRFHLREQVIELMEKSGGDASRKNQEKGSVNRGKTHGYMIIGVVLIATVIGGILWVPRIPFVRYRYAEYLLVNGKIEKAKNIYESLQGIYNCDKQLVECNYAIAKAVYEEGNYETAKAIFESLNGYDACEAMINECDFAIAKKLMEDEKYAEAYRYFEALNDYKNSLAYKQNAMIKGLLNCKEGDSVWFAQLFDEEDKAADLEWIVLERNLDKALLISKYVLFEGDYDEEGWKQTYYRWFENNERFRLGLTNQAREALMRKSFFDGNTKYITTFFILTEDEVQKYFKEQELSILNLKGNPCNMLLRGEKMVRIIDSVAAYPYKGFTGGVRPAVWIDLSKLVE